MTQLRSTACNDHKGNAHGQRTAPQQPRTEEAKIHHQEEACHDSRGFAFPGRASPEEAGLNPAPARRQARSAAGADDYFRRIRSAVQSDLSHNGAGEFALSLVRQIGNDAREAGLPDLAKDVIADVTARLSRESLDATDAGRQDWSVAYDMISHLLSTR
jgi:hypothetical protein